jgi:type I restriction enzyme S subunit
MTFPAYPSYKGSGSEWLGEVPQHWKVLIAKRLFRNVRDASQPGAEQLAATQAYGVIPQKDFMEKNDVKVVLALSGTHNFKDVLVDDFVISLRSFQGGIEYSAYSGCVSPAYTVLRRNSAGGASPAFFKYLLKDDAYISALQSVTTGIREGKTITYDQFGSLLLPVAPFSEQAQIARFLDHETVRIDALIEQQQRLIELLKEKRQAVISHAVTKGLDPTVPMKDSGVEWLGEVPVHWCVKRLKYLVPAITVGIVVEPSKYYVDEGIPALRSLNVKPGAVVSENLVYLSPESNDLHSKSKIYEGDIVAVRSGQPGTAAIVPPEFNGANCIDLIVIRKPLEGCSTFIFWYLNGDAALKQFSEGASGAIQQHFNISAASELIIVWPPTGEQQDINKYLARASQKLDRLIAEAGESKSLLLERRSALISAAVTGKIDVRGWQPAASASSPELAQEAV